MYRQKRHKDSKGILKETDGQIYEEPAKLYKKLPFRFSKIRGGNG